MGGRRIGGTAGWLLGAALVAGAAAPAGPVLVSEAAGGGVPDGPSLEGSASDSGKLVVFDSSASDLVDGPANGDNYEIYLRDLGTGATRMISLAPKADPDDPDIAADNDCNYPCMSANGSVVVFTSSATNLVPGDDEGEVDVFAADLRTGAIRRISQAPDGTGGNDQSYAVGRCLSKNGRYVVFTSFATNLVPGESYAGSVSNVFLHDLREGTTVRLTGGLDGMGADAFTSDAAISPNGRFATYVSSATNLEEGFGNHNEVYVEDLRKGTRTMVSRVEGQQANGNCFEPSVANNGRVVAFRSQANNLVLNDSNGYFDAFVADLKAGTMTRVSVAGDLGQANNHTTDVVLSPTGKSVLFVSAANNLLPEATDFVDQVYLRDLKKGTLRLLTASAAGAPGDGPSQFDTGGISPNGKWLVFSTTAANLAPGAGSGAQRVLLVRAK